MTTRGSLLAHIIHEVCHENGGEPFYCGTLTMLRQAVPVPPVPFLGPRTVPAASPSRRRAQTWCDLFVAPCALNVFQREEVRLGALGAGRVRRSRLRFFREPAGSPKTRSAHHSRASTNVASLIRDAVDLAGVHKHDAPYSSRRAPCGLASTSSSFASQRRIPRTDS